MKLTAGRLPKGFVLAKPIAQEGYDEAVIYELERQGRLIITRKRDGWKMLALVGRNNTIRLYTDGINEIDDRLEHIKKELRSFGFPPQSLFVGEAFCADSKGDDLTRIISIFHSGRDKAVTLQNEGGKVLFMVFAIIDLGKKSEKYNIDWFQTIKARGCEWDPLLSWTHKERTDYVFSVPFENITFNEAKKIVIEKGWEGLVLYDKDYQLTYRTDGKAPKRPEGCYKWKPIWEDDFIVREFIARPDGDVKELVLSQADPSGKEFYCGKLGSFSNAMRRDLSRVDYPIVVQTAFEMRFPKTGKIRNARFLRIRSDKPISQCISSKKYPEAKYNGFFRIDS